MGGRRGEEEGIRVSAVQAGVEVAVAVGTAAAKTLEKGTERGRERGVGRRIARNGVGSTDTDGVDVIAGATVAAGVGVGAGMRLAVCGTAAGTPCCPMKTSVAAGSWTCTGKGEKRERTEVSIVERGSLTGGRTEGV